MKKISLLLAACLLATAPWITAVADVKVGVSLSLTGPGSGLGIPEGKQFKITPTTLGGEKVEFIILDDASDPGKAASNTRRFITEDKVDLVVGSSITAASVAMVDLAADAKTVQLSLAPVGTALGKDGWLFRLPQSNTVMGHALVEHMQAQKVKSLGFLAYTDAYGEQYIKEMTPLLDKAGIKVLATERFARTDTNVTGQALKLVGTNPDAIMIIASGSGAAMPHMAVVERGYKGKIYQTHGAASPDLTRVGGKSVEGAYLVSGPAVVAEQLKDTHPSKKQAIDFVTKFEKAYGPNSRNQFAGHAYDVGVVLNKALPLALKKGKPGSDEFREGLKTAFETMGHTVLAHGVLNWTPSDHWGYTNETGVMLKVVNGKFEVE